MLRRFRPPVRNSEHEIPRWIDGGDDERIGGPELKWTALFQRRRNAGRGQHDTVKEHLLYPDR